MIFNEPSLMEEFKKQIKIIAIEFDISEEEAERKLLEVIQVKLGDEDLKTFIK